MDIADIASPEFLEVEADTRLGKVRALFDRENPKGVVVTDDDAFAGVIGERELLQSHVEDSAKASALIKPSRNAAVPKLDRHEDIRTVARYLVEGGTKVAPVFEGDELWGVITEDLILAAVLESLDALTVGDIYTEDPTTVHSDDGLGKAINHLREHGVSRLPVLDDDGLLVGVVTTHDIADVVVRDMDKLTTGDRAGELDRVLDLPIYDIMSSPVTTTHVGATVREAVAQMLEHDYGGLPVTDVDDDRQIVGILAKTDVLRALSHTEEEHLDVQITNVHLLDTISRQAIREDIEAVADKYQRMRVHHAHVRFHEHKEKLRGTPLIQCQIRLRTNKGQLAGTGEGYGADNAFHVALDKLERNVIERKGLRRDKVIEGHVLRKLGEL
ncbi:MAG: CBS domain-containing protein [Halobacteriales archaeon]